MTDCPHCAAYLEKVKALRNIVDDSWTIEWPEEPFEHDPEHHEIGGEG